MATAFWIAFTLVAIVWTLVLRLTVRFTAKNADNGWDNAIAYGVATLLLSVPIRWLFSQHDWWWWTLAPVVLWIGQTWSLKTIYELRTLHAWLIGVVHGVVTSITVSVLTCFAGVIAAYIMYGRIVADPMILVRLVLRLIGIEWPFELPLNG